MGNFHAVQMLSNRLLLLRDYVDAVMRGELPLQPGRMREIRTLLSRLSRSSELDGIEDKREENTLLRQVNDVCLNSILAGLTRALQTLHAWTIKEKLITGRVTKDVTVKGGTHQRSCNNLKAMLSSRQPIVATMEILTSSVGDGAEPKGQPCFD